MTDYYIASKTHITSTRGTKTIQFISASRRDGRFHREMAFEPGGTTVNVFDGKNEWTVFPDRKQYLESALGASDTESPFENVQEHLCALGRSPVGQARWLRTETATVGGRAVVCDVFEFAPGQTCWIDSQAHTVVLERQDYSNGSRSDTEYSQVRLRQEPPSSLFMPPDVSGLSLIRMPGRGMLWRATWSNRYKGAREDLDAARDVEGRLISLVPAAKAAFEIQKFDEANRYARELLNLAPQFQQHWIYGGAVHDGHMVLGRLALRRGDLVTAKRELLEAGKTPGDPGLSSHGPNMSLAKDLLELDEVDTVREYLHECKSFWEAPEPLNSWIAMIDRGEVPDFGAHLRL